MVRKCKNCNKYAIYAYQGETKPKYCKDHIDEGMVDVVNKQCNDTTCNKYANYADQGATKPKYCKTHAYKGMVDVVSKQCNAPGCQKRPLFAEPGETVPIRCAGCRDPNMIDIMNKTCDTRNCYKKPYFAKDGDDTPIYCNEHADHSMIDIVNKKCDHPDCQKQPSFAKKGKAAHKCFDHKDKDMENVAKKKCDDEGCTKQPVVGFPGNPLSHCLTHKQEGMKIKSSKKCQYENCKNLALYGFNKPQWCESHQPEGSYNFVEKRCSNCNLLNVLRPNGMCGDCYKWEYNGNVRLEKQNDIAQFLQNECNFPCTSYDQKIPNLINAYERPDFYFDYDKYAIILEVDEHQHFNRQCECEQKRMVNIGQSIQKPTLFIRYNPDEYKPPSGKQVPQNQRKQKLFSVLNNPPNFMAAHCCIGAVYLFFDGHTQEGCTHVYSLNDVDPDSGK